MSRAALAGLLVCLLAPQTNAESTAIDEEKEEASVDAALTELLASPQATVRTLITSINEDNKAAAAKCLDLSDFNVVITEKKGQHLAPLLKEIIDRMRRVRYADHLGLWRATDV